MKIDLMIPEHAYLFGLLQTDGHHSESTRNRGKISISLSSRDEDVLIKISKLLDVNFSLKRRISDTNFKKNFAYTVLTMHDLDFRTQFKNLGLPVGKKSAIIAPPICDFSELDYIRGLIDGDGSLGVTSKNLPFLSFTTQSEEVAKYYIKFLSGISGYTKINNRNTRDAIYNIAVFREEAQKAIKEIYYDGCFAINRKLKKAEEALGWERALNNKKRDFSVKKWDSEQDNFVKNNTILDSMAFLGRTEKSIKIRLWRLGAYKGM